MAILGVIPILVGDGTQPDIRTVDSRHIGRPRQVVLAGDIDILRQRQRGIALDGQVSPLGRLLENRGRNDGHADGRCSRRHGGGIVERRRHDGLADNGTQIGARAERRPVERRQRGGQRDGA